MTTTAELKDLVDRAYKSVICKDDIEYFERMSREANSVEERARYATQLEQLKNAIVIDRGATDVAS